ncbi:hypothetical protein V8C42DRAFT_357967 [Trichoderma barbatum]
MDPFVYLPVYRLVVCQRCRFACVADEIITHLQTRHPEIPSVERKRIVGTVQRINKIIHNQRELENFQYPPPTTEPIPFIEPPRDDGLGCVSCPYIACQLQKIQAHCRKEHNWTNPRKRGRLSALQLLDQTQLPWRKNVQCQRFFRSRGASSWFEVGRGQSHHSRVQLGKQLPMSGTVRKHSDIEDENPACATVEADIHLGAVLRREQQYLDKNSQPTMDRTQWDQTYKGDRRDIFQALIQLPDRRYLATDYPIGQRTCNGRPELSCIETVQKTSHHYACSRKPFSLVSKVASKKRYRRLWKCLVVFVFRSYRLLRAISEELVDIPLRQEVQNLVRAIFNHEAWEHINVTEGVWPNGENWSACDRHPILEPDKDSSWSENDTSSSDTWGSDDENGKNNDMDIPNDFSDEDSWTPQSPQELASIIRDNHLRGALNIMQPEPNGQNTNAKSDQIIELLFQLSLALMTERYADGQPNSTLLIYFSGILGFTAHGKEYRPAKQYTPIISGLIYIQRLLFLEYALPLRAYSSIGIPQRPQFRQHEQLELIRKKYIIAGSQSPFDELHSLRNFGRVIARTDPPSFLLRWSDDGESVFYGDAFKLSMDCFRRLADYFITQSKEICSNLMLDDLTNAQFGYSFIEHLSNGSRKAYFDLVAEACKPGRLFDRHTWNWAAISSYRKKVTKLQEMMLGGFYTACGQVPRAEDLLALDYENGPFTKCGIYIWNGYVIYIVRTHKAKRITNREFYVVRFLPARLAIYLFSTDGQPWKSNRLTSILKRATVNVWGHSINIQLYRQITIGITEKHVRELCIPFNQYDDRGAEADMNVVFAWQSGHRPLQRGITYGLDGAYPSRLQPSLLRAYE